MSVLTDLSADKKTRAGNLSTDYRGCAQRRPVGVASAGLAIAMMSGCSWTGLATLNSSGEQANNDSFLPAASEDARYIAFQSAASNLVATDSNGVQDVFVRDINAGTTSRVSISSAGLQGNGGSYEAAISHDGRYVAFASDATNLVSADNNNVRDVFLHDRDTGSTRRLSAFGLITPVEGNGASENVDITCFAGCVAVFESGASNLVTGDANGVQDIFRWSAGSIERLSVDSSGDDADGSSANASLSAGGGLMAFDSTATNLLTFGTDTNGFRDVYVRNTALDENSIISTNWIGGYANNNSQNPAISADGRFVAFESQASDLVFGDSNTATAIYVRDRFNFFTEKVSVNDAGETANAASLEPFISGDGRYVAFWSDADNLVAGDSNNARDIFVRDRQKNTTSRVSVDQLGAQSNGLSTHPVLSIDGRYVSFSSAADNLVPDDDNDINIGPGFFRSAFDIVVRAVGSISVDSIVPNVLPVGTTTSVTLSGQNFFPTAIADIEGDSETVSNLVIVDENTLTMQVTVPPDATTGARNVTVFVPGTGAGVAKGNLGICPGCVIYQ